jgi:hypothetical protein
MGKDMKNLPRFICYVFNANGRVISQATSYKRDKAIRVASRRVAKYYNDITIKVEVTV